MSNPTAMTMQNPLYGAQSAHFQQAVRQARHERTRVLRKLAEVIFGHRVNPDEPAPAAVDKASAISIEMLKYARPF